MFCISLLGILRPKINGLKAIFFFLHSALENNNNLNIVFEICASDFEGDY